MRGGKTLPVIDFEDWQGARVKKPRRIIVSLVRN